MEFNSKNYKYFEAAKRASYNSNYPRLKFGAVLVQGNKILSNGWNSDRTHPLQKRLNRHRDFSEGDGKGADVVRLHAEIHCLLPFDENDDLHKCELYIYRRSGDGKGMSRPCPACMARVRELGIRKIYYTTQSGYVYDEVV